VKRTKFFVDRDRVVGVRMRDCVRISSLENSPKSNVKVTLIPVRCKRNDDPRIWGLDRGVRWGA